VNNTVHRPKVVLQSMLSHLGCLRWFVFVLMITFYSGTLSSQIISDEQAESKPLRFDITALVDYRTRMLFPTGHPPSCHLVLGAKPSYGTAIGMRLDEENLVEFRWARQDTRVHFASSDEKVVLDQFHGDFTHEYIPEEGLRWARPFVMGSAGATQVAGGANSSFTRFSFGLGGGIKVYFTPPPSSENAGGMVTTRGRT